MNYKKITIIALALFYSFSLFILSTDTLLSDILQVRQNIIIHSKTKETLLLSKQSWDKLATKDEFKYNDSYYDVKKVVVYKNFVKVEVVKDMLELVIKEITENLNDKLEKSNLLNFKKSIVIYYSKPTSIGFAFTSVTLKNNYSYCNYSKNQFLASLFRPPCFS